MHDDANAGICSWQLAAGRALDATTATLVVSPLLPSPLFSSYITHLNTQHAPPSPRIHPVAQNAIENIPRHLNPAWLLTASGSGTHAIESTQVIRPLPGRYRPPQEGSRTTTRASGSLRQPRPVRTRRSLQWACHTSQGFAPRAGTAPTTDEAAAATPARQAVAFSLALRAATTPRWLCWSEGW